MNFKFLKPLLSILIICVVSVFAYSCKDDEIDCDKAIDNIEEAFDNYDEAIDEGNCEALDDLFDAAVKQLRKAKNCKEVKEELEDIGFDSVEDFIDLLELQHNEEVDDCNTPE